MKTRVATAPAPLAARAAIAALLLSSLYAAGAWALPADDELLVFDASPVARSFSAPAVLPQVLRFGMQGPEVRALQVRLRHARMLVRRDVTSRFDVNTRESLRRFQAEQGLPPTGVLDQASWDALLLRSYEPTQDELDNREIGAWYVSPDQPGFVRELQQRLRQLGHFQGPRDGRFTRATGAAVADFRYSVDLPASPVVDERTWFELVKRSRAPRYRQLHEQLPVTALEHELDPRCLQGKVVCISKAQERVSLVVDSTIQLTREARFASPGWESPEGEFRVWYKNQNNMSTKFGERIPMPYAIFYEGNVGLHYSDDFHRTGYANGSHGCSQLRDYQTAHWLFEQVAVGDKVVVY